ncbi:MAG TPA: DUF349 domain-containing protein [Bacteroidia bacterium]|nr:DUF349 domain-containing protein [Bacteroidia bacterium]
MENLNRQEELERNNLDVAIPADDLGEEPEQENLTYEIGTAQEEDAVDYANLSKEELVELAIKASKSEDLKEAAEVMRQVRPILDNIFLEEQNTALAAFIEEGGDKDSFEYKGTELKTQFYEAFKTVQRRRSEERERVEKDKLKNLEAKRAILDKLKHLTESDETENSVEQVRELQREWKKIRVVPQEYVQELWDSYRFYMDKFYDNVSINNELKELDRKKNLEHKIELCKKVGELSEEKSIKKSLILLNKYHEEWKNTGPVPREFSEEIWKRFKEASDLIYEQKRGEIAKLEEVRKQNFELKTAICEKLDLLTSTKPNKPKEWIDMTKQVNDLFDEWRKIGKVPREQNEIIWGRFRELRNRFFNEKNAFFRKLNAEKAENLRLKTEICEKAEAVVASEDWQKTANTLKKLQEDWKKIGPVPEKVSDTVWKRFRAACDSFFNRKEEHFKGQKEEQQGNLDKKTELLTRLETLVNSEAETEAAFAQARQIQKEWGEIGFVPFNAKKNIQDRFSEAMDKLYKKLKRNPEEMSEARLKEHYEEISKLPDAAYKLKNEERRVREKIRFLRTDIETLENNVGFFRTGNAKGANNPFVKQIEDKISKASGQLSRLERELKVIRSFGQ